MITTTVQRVPVSSALVHASAHGPACPFNQAHTGFPAFPLCPGRHGQLIRCHRVDSKVSCRKCRHQRQLIPHAQPDRKPEPKPDQGGVEDLIRQSLAELAEQLEENQVARQELTQQLRESIQEFELRLASSKKDLEESAGLAKVAPWIACQVEQAMLGRMSKSEKETIEADKQLQQRLEALEQKWERQQQVAQRQEPQEEPVESSDVWSEAFNDAAAGVEGYFDRPIHARARDQAFVTLLQSTLAAALIHSLFGIDFLGQWRWAQNGIIAAAFTAIYLLSLLGIGSLSGDNRNGNMQQLTWFPLGRSEPGWTPPTELQQANLKAFAVMDLRQASQFAAAQAWSTGIVWRGGVLVLVSSALHGNGAGYSVGLHGENIQSALQAGLVVFPAWAQSQRILEVAAITAFIEAVCQEVSVVVQAWAQPLMLEGPGQTASYSAEYMEERVSQLSDAIGEEQSMHALGLTLNGERVAQHALISGLLALEVLVTGSLPAAMLTQALGYMLGWQSVRSQLPRDDTADG